MEFAMFIGVLWFMFLALLALGESGESRGICPRCEHELTEVGFEGWKKRCDRCKWRNYGKNC